MSVADLSLAFAFGFVISGFAYALGRCYWALANTALECVD